MDGDSGVKSEKAIFFSVTDITTLPPQHCMELCYVQGPFTYCSSFDYLSNLQKQEEEADGQK